MKRGCEILKTIIPSTKISNCENNVLAVIGDQKLPMLQGGVVVSFEAHVISSQDYSPFGVTLSGRSWSAGYRYGFQNQETDEEIWGGAINYKYRVEDQKLGRFFSVDPLSHRYPYYYSYQFSGNRLIDMVELEGLEPAEPRADDEIKSAPIQGQESSGSKNWAWFNNQWNIINAGVTEITEAAPDYKSIVLTVTNKDSGLDAVVATIRNKNVNWAVNIGTYDYVPEVPLVIDMTDWQTKTESDEDAFMINIGFGFAGFGGVGYSVQLVNILGGVDMGYHLYHNLDINTGLILSAGFSWGVVDFNDKSGAWMTKSSFEGKSQGWSWGIGPYGETRVTAYTDGEWRMTGIGREKLYEVTLRGLGVGGDLGLTKTWSKTSKAFASCPYHY